MADKESLAPDLSRDDRALNEDVAAIPLVEERLEVTKKAVESGRVRVHVTVDERREEVVEQLMRDDVEIERIPQNIPLSQMPHVRLEGTTTIVPVVEEVVVVEKRLMLIEEIHIRRRSEAEARAIPVTLRTERASIERDGVRENIGPESISGDRTAFRTEGTN